MNQVGFHFVDSVYSESHAIQHLALLHATKPAVITILGGAQYEQALAFAKRAKSAFPAMRVIFRHFINKSRPDDDDKDTFEPQAEDTGRHTRMSAEAWWERVGRLYIGTGLTILPDNESTMGDYTPYSIWMSKVLELAGAAGVGIAYGRFPAFHPAKGKEQHLDAMLKSAFKFGKLHTYSPNVYWSADNFDAFKYPGYVISYAAKLGITLDTTIGEFALLRDVGDAWHGWRSCNVSGKVAALDTIIKAKVHLPGIPVCVYSIGAWPISADTFSLDTDALDTIKANLTPLDAPPIVIPPTPPQEETPVISPNDPRFKPHVLRAATAAKFNVRALPSISAAVVVTLEPATDYPCYAIPRAQLTAAEKAETTSGANIWHVIELNNGVGYVRSDAGTVTEVVTPPPPPPDDTPLTDAERIKYTIENLKMIEYHMQEAYNRIAVVLSAWEVLEAETIGE